ncbi:hypothetical protein SDRG_15560 [Saprolegnia diclina VS20]|uniref:Cytochrome b561 domain-containing protein n=1 Tax=Saprolegnia diclina (strain VS20) TaxID=1156394 RepID=T0PZU2_SAPDV|nr:hypothetical protein SDRG_15560 [Saprolegnia diclina VS20]EQC26620.1 hypothetical protein SDRG_15560 [Saprolegnia diclina VS20]|eukprot:XP_008619958.1 hypothetical protein SDRG_15560 [Saprolegnia diclina VS20]
MDVELPTSRGQLPARKPSEADESDAYDRSTVLSSVAGDDDDDEHGPPAAHSYARSPSVVWSELRDNIAPVTWYCLVAALAICVAVMIKTGVNLLFVHILMMTLGWVAFSSEAMLVYRPFDGLNARSPNKRIQRNIHKFMHYAVLATTLLGLAGILISRGMAGKRLFPHNKHGWMGFITVALMLLQMEVGRRKLKFLQFQGRTIFEWHGFVGKLTYASGIASTILGLTHVFRDDMVYVWSAVVMSVVVFVVYAYVRRNKTAGYAVVDQL